MPQSVSSGYLWEEGLAIIFFFYSFYFAVFSKHFDNEDVHIRNTMCGNLMRKNLQLKTLLTSHFPEE